MRKKVQNCYTIVHPILQTHFPKGASLLAALKKHAFSPSHGIRQPSMMGYPRFRRNICLLSDINVCTLKQKKKQERGGISIIPSIQTKELNHYRKDSSLISFSFPFPFTVRIHRLYTVHSTPEIWSREIKLLTNRKGYSAGTIPIPILVLIV